jgi:general secretion pathway protein K
VTIQPLPPRQCRRQGGTALLLAMLTMALVASLSATAFWHQWKSWSIEQAERQRTQSAWLLTGALDWARLILREDARASSVDHLAEPWALPLQEARISNFLAADPGQTDGLLLEAFLSGQVEDQQGKLNARNLVEGNASERKVSPSDQAAFGKLFAALNLPAQELEVLAQGLQLALNSADVEPDRPRPLLPERFEQLAWLGLSPQTLASLSPHATWLPERTTLNLNTATELALYANVPGLERSQARVLLEQRGRQHFSTLEEAASILGNLREPLNPQRLGTTSRYFAVSGELRLDNHWVYERSLVVRNGLQVQTVWREKGAHPPASNAWSR